jgi:DNA-binding FrmR family transcriptional regulator
MSTEEMAATDESGHAQHAPTEHVHPAPHAHTGPHGYSGDKPALLGRLRRIEGQVRGLQRMVDEDTYCIDVLTQISAATRALQAVAVGLLEDHLGHCVVDAARSGDPTAKVKEATDAIARLVRS